MMGVSHTLPDGHVVVRFDEHELREFAALARSRNDAKLRRGIISRRVDRRRDDVALNYDAIRAEQAVATAIGGHADTTISPAGRKDGNLILPDGGRAMVHYAGRRGYDLSLMGGATVAAAMAHFRGEAAFLVWPRSAALMPDEAEGLEVVGWISREEFEKRCVWRSYGSDYPLRLAVPASRLHPVAELAPWRRHLIAPVTMQLGLLP